MHKARKKRVESSPCQANMASESLLKQLACRRIESLFIGKINHRNTLMLIVKHYSIDSCIISNESKVEGMSIMVFLESTCQCEKKAFPPD